MHVGETRRELLARLAEAAGAREASWAPVSAAPERYRSGAAVHGRPSWSAAGPRGAWPAGAGGLWLLWVVLVVVLGLNLVSERVSFTAVIDRTPPLRWIDRVGSPHRR